MNGRLEISEGIDKKALRDILDLDEKINLFKKGEINDESFRAFRLARGIYRQRAVFAGGLGAQPFMAHIITDFMEESRIIPFTKACLRIFDRYGERAKRHKTRLKYLIQDMGLDPFKFTTKIKYYFLHV